MYYNVETPLINRLENTPVTIVESAIDIVLEVMFTNFAISLGPHFVESPSIPGSRPSRSAKKSLMSQTLHISGAVFRQECGNITHMTSVDSNQWNSSGNMSSFIVLKLLQSSKHEMKHNMGV